MSDTHLQSTTELLSITVHNMCAVAINKIEHHRRQKFKDLYNKSIQRRSRMLEFFIGPKIEAPYSEAVFQKFYYEWLNEDHIFSDIHRATVIHMEEQRAIRKFLKLAERVVPNSGFIYMTAQDYGMIISWDVVNDTESLVPEDECVQLIQP